MVYYIILILVILVLAGVAVMLYKSNKENKNEASACAKSTAIQGRLEDHNIEMQEKKEMAKQKILEMLAGKDKISNKEVAKELGVSRNSVINYFDELEKEGKVKQVGKTGRNVFYSKL